MLSDAHVHFIPEVISKNTSFYKGVWADKYKLFSYLDENDIAKALLCYPSTDAHLRMGGFTAVCNEYNNAIEALLKENEKLCAAALISINDVSSAVSEIENLKKRGFKAVNIASSENGMFEIKEMIPVFEAASEKDLFIFVHPQTFNPIGYERVNDPLLMPVLEYSFDVSMFMGLLMMEDVFSKCGAKFVFSSLGGVMPFMKDRFDRVYSMLRTRGMVKDLGALPSEILKKVYVDTSGAPVANIKLAINMFGADNVLWGSDYPVCGDIKTEIDSLQLLGPEICSKILHENFEKVFGQ
ncbi:MAG: amidohydrolase family protein [Candidatus Omnitrophica bacterium]|nr:amidohydrolase family protein [Candidatus Omnitrophota bacterium]